MIIEKLEIENFGKFHNQEIVLKKGINIIYGENEWGKSTIHGFIRGMFFGLERLRGKGARTDMYNRYEPWDNPGHYKGAMEFSCGGKRFRLERNFHKDGEAVRLVSLEDGEQLSAKNGDLDMLLGEINQGIFDNTVSVGQLKSVTGKELWEELQNYIANYQGGADEDINLREAMEILKDRKRKLLQKKDKQQESRTLARRELQAQINLLESQQRNCLGKIQEQEKKEEILREGEQTKAADSSRGKVSKMWKGITLSWTGITLLSIVLALVFHGKDLSLVFILMACVAGVQIPVSVFIQKWIMKKLTAAREKEGQPIMPLKEDSWEQQEGRLSQLREDYGEGNVMLENLRQEYEDMEEAEYEITPIEEDIEAVELAISTLTKTVAAMQNSIGETLRSRMGEILNELTGERYTHVSVDHAMNITIETLHRSIQLHQLSRGTLEQVYFALRMAAGEILCGREPMPIILDEVFSMYDENRLWAALAWLKKHKEQTILLTCHKREEELLEKMEERDC